jgi:hypothetical protein
MSEDPPSQGDVKPSDPPAVAVPRHASEITRRIVNDLHALLDLYRGGDLTELAEQKAMACVAMAAYELSRMPGTPHRGAIIEEVGAFLAALVDANEAAARRLLDDQVEAAGDKQVDGPGATNVKFFLDEKNRF